MPSGRPKPRDWRGASSSELRRGAAIAQFDDIQAAEWQPMRELLEDLSRDRAVQGFSPTETAIFVFSLKEPLFALLRARARRRRRPARQRDLDRQSAARQARPLHDRVLRANAARR